jgi:hypothetical protein
MNRAHSGSSSRWTLVKAASDWATACEASRESPRAAWALAYSAHRSAAQAGL